MNTKSEYGEVMKHGVAAEGGFNIKTTATAFKILSEGLYSDKILAFVRELACNAHDAHVAAKNQKTPIQVHLPNKLEPYFEIKDFGVGLHPDDVFGLYTTYFESTKSNSDEFIGQMGLGSKSPFAYCDCFSVSSRFNSEEYHFTAFIDDAGIPAIALLNKTPTNEHNGLTIRIPIRQMDFGEVAEKVKRVFQRFDPKPEIQGGIIIWTQEEKPIAWGKNWRLYPNNYSRNAARVIMGLIEYQTRGYHYLNDLEYWMLNSNMEIDFAIGELSVTASRESISFDKHTVAAFHNKLNEIKNELAAQIEDQIHSQPTLWQAAVKKNEISNQSLLSQAVDRNSKIQWRGKDIPDEFVYEISDKVKIEHFWVKNNQVTFKRETCNNKLFLKPKSNIEIYYNGLGDVYRAHTKKRINQQDRKNLYYVIHKNPNTTLKEFQMELTKISETLGNFELKDLLNIEIIQQPRNIKKTPVLTYRTVKVLHGEIRRKKYGYVDYFIKENAQKFLESNTIIWYIPLFNDRAIIGAKEDGSAVTTYHPIHSAFNVLRKLGLDIPKEVVGVPFKKIKKLPNNWVNAIDKVREFVLRKDIQEKIDAIFGCQAVIKNFRDFIGNYYEYEASKIEGVEMREIFSLYQEAKKTQETYGSMTSMAPLMTLLKSMNIDIQITTNIRFENMINQFKRKYPLLLMISTYDLWRNHNNMVNTYIQAINLLEQNNKMQEASII